ncbi:LOW QUALITY PROTEIN: thioredoxin-like protein 1 [Rhinophrynus dorsalis]
MVGVKVIGGDAEFQPELSGAGSRLSVVKFTMRGCAPCIRIAPVFTSLSNKYPQAVFLEVDVHQCQLLMTVAFNQPVKLFMKLQGPDNGQGPKYVKIFINLPRSMDFDEAMRSEPTQAIELSPDDIKEDSIVQLRYVKFQNVNSVTLFVQSNQGDEEATRISYFTFIGTPVQATNMNDFKRVVGKKGESH